MKRIYTFSLRPTRDSDLVESLKKVEGGDLSQIVREGLRKVLGRGDVIQKEPEKKAPAKWDPTKW